LFSSENSNTDILVSIKFPSFLSHSYLAVVGIFSGIIVSILSSDDSNLLSFIIE